MTRPLSFISPGFFGFCVVYVLISCILFAQNKTKKTQKKPVVCRTWKELRMHSWSPKKLNYQSRRSHSYIGCTWEGQAAKVSYNLYLLMYLGPMQQSCREPVCFYLFFFLLLLLLGAKQRSCEGNPLFLYVFLLLFRFLLLPLESMAAHRTLW